MERSAMIRSYDLVVIGAGPAGESAAELAAFLGDSVVIVEKNKPGGGHYDRRGAYEDIAWKIGKN